LSISPFLSLFLQFQAHGAEVIGVSLDTVGSQEQFSSCLGLPFILLSDYPGGLHTIFSNSRLDQVQRRTYVVDKWGFLVDKVGWLSFSDLKTSGLSC